MVLYRYTAKNQDGEIKEGSFEAENLREAMQSLIEQGLEVVSLAKAPPESREWGSGVSDSELSQVSRKLASLTEMGAPLTHSLTVITAEIRSPRLREVLRSIQKKLENGRPLSEAMARLPQIFSPFHVRMIEAGEQSGTVPHMLYRLADIWQKQARLRSRLRDLLIYPSCIFLVVLLFAVVFRIYLFPHMVELYPNPELIPAFSRLFIGLLDISFVLLPILLVAGIIFWSMAKRSHDMRIGLARVALGVPIVGNLIKEIVATRFSRTFGMLLRGGMEPTGALQLAARVVGNPLAERELEEASEQVAAGNSLGAALSNCRCLPRDLVLAVSLSADRGSISQDLLEMADHHDMAIDVRINALLSVLEPLILVVLGLFVGACALSAWLPYIWMDPKTMLGGN